MFSKLVGLVLATVGVVVLAGCSVFGISGSGAIVSESRPVAAFDRIEASYGISVNVRIGAAAPLTVETYENLKTIIATVVEGGTLKVYATREFNAAQRPVVSVSVPSLAGVSSSGGSQITVDSLAAESFAAELSGGSVLTVTGTASQVALESSGGAQAELTGLQAGRVVLDVSGGAGARVTASQEVTGSVSGGGSAVVYGTATITAVPSGGGSITHG